MKPDVLGFTGTRKGMTLAQKAEVIAYLKDKLPDRVVHGDCVGADAEFDEICRVLGIPRGIRPCTIESMRARCDLKENAAIVLAAPKPPMARNRDIVTDSFRLLATPLRRRMGSGTWATIGFGERANRPVCVVLPDGTVVPR